MKRKVNTLSKNYSAILESIDNVDAIILGETAEVETYDPYFLIEFDVFYNKEIPGPAERKKLLKSPGAFETSPVYPIDRFLRDGLPVLIYYRNITGIDALFKRIEQEQWVFRKEATNTLYRLQKGQILYKDNDWIDHIQTQLNSLPDTFWENIINSSKFLVENSLMEMGVAVLKNNSLLYQNALSGFIQNVSGFVFALNRQFTPHPRLLSKQLLKLKIMPDEFVSRFEGICSLHNEYTPERKVEIVKLIVKSLITLELAKN